MTENITKDQVLQLMKKQDEEISRVRNFGVVKLVPGDQLNKSKSNQESKQWQIPNNANARIAVIGLLIIKSRGLAFIFNNFDLFVSKLGTDGLTGLRLKIFLIYYRNHRNDFQAQNMNINRLIDGFVEHMTQLETPPTKHAESRFRY